MEKLTAKTLIEILSKFPPDTPVHLEKGALVYDMEASDVTHDPDGILVISFKED